MRLLVALMIGLVSFPLVGCSGNESDSSQASMTTLGTGPEPTADPNQRHPEVLDATFSARSDGAFDISVTLSSPYDSPDRYADAWRVSTLDGQELGIRELAHDHANEQPFTRSLSAVSIPDDIDVVVIDGRDQENGWGEGVVFDIDR